MKDTKNNNAEMCPVCFQCLIDCTREEKLDNPGVLRSKTCINSCYSLSEIYSLNGTFFQERISTNNAYLLQTWKKSETTKQMKLRERISSFHKDLICHKNFVNIFKNL